MCTKDVQYAIQGNYLKLELHEATFLSSESCILHLLLGSGRSSAILFPMLLKHPVLALYIRQQQYATANSTTPPAMGAPMASGMLLLSPLVGDSTDIEK